MSTFRAVMLLIPMLAVSLQAMAQAAYPNRPVRIIVAFPPGQATDQSARAVAQKLSESLGQQFIVDNRPGAASIIGTEAAAKAPNDGYTLLMASSGSFAVNPGIYAKLPYDPIRDFTPVSAIMKVPFFVAAGPALPVNNLRDLVAHVKSNPGKVNFGSAGSGAANHLAAEYFMSVAGLSMVHIPYKGSPPAVADLLGGQIAIMFETGPLIVPQVKAGKLKGIAVATPVRSSALPDLPTIAESGYPGFESAGWAGLVAPAGTPRDIIQKLNAEVVKILAQPELPARFVAMGAELASSTPEAFGTYIRSEIAKWGKVIRDAGVKVE